MRILVVAAAALTLTACQPGNRTVLMHRDGTLMATGNGVKVDVYLGPITGTASADDARSYCGLLDGTYRQAAVGSQVEAYCHDVAYHP